MGNEKRSPDFEGENINRMFVVQSTQQMTRREELFAVVIEIYRI
jgi:hypothetical protein